MQIMTWRFSVFAQKILIYVEKMPTAENRVYSFEFLKVCSLGLSFLFYFLVFLGLIFFSKCQFLILDYLGSQFKPGLSSHNNNVST